MRLFRPRSSRSSRSSLPPTKTSPNSSHRTPEASRQYWRGFPASLSILRAQLKRPTANLWTLSASASVSRKRRSAREVPNAWSSTETVKISPCALTTICSTPLCSLSLSLSLAASGVSATRHFSTCSALASSRPSWLAIRTSISGICGTVRSMRAICRQSPTLRCSGQCSRALALLGAGVSSLSALARMWHQLEAYRTCTCSCRSMARSLQ
mmetsp:Transcript_143116/g.263925  ORF Transcript_143116/g.263925 Transcript_143116/m.263925 type:complete len:211 (-) Transcript_143116:175-807(-)